MTIPHSSLFALKLFSALGCGLIAGVFFAFSTFVMNTLAQQPPAQGISTMQSTVKPDSTAGADLWARYLTTWTF